MFHPLPPFHLSPPLRSVTLTSVSLPLAVLGFLHPFLPPAPSALTWLICLHVTSVPRLRVCPCLCVCVSGVSVALSVHVSALGFVRGSVSLFLLLSVWPSCVPPSLSLFEPIAPFSPSAPTPLCLSLCLSLWLSVCILLDPAHLPPQATIRCFWVDPVREAVLIIYDAVTY